MSASAQSVLVNTAVATAGRVINTLLGVVVTAFITHSLGLAQFGSYTILLAYASILQIATDAGLYLTLSRVIAESPHREQEYISHTIWLRLLLGVIVFGLGAVVLFSIPAQRIFIGPFIVLAMGFLFQSLSQLLMSVYQKYGIVWRVSLGDILGRGAHIGALVGIAGFQHITIATAISAFTIGTAVAFLVHYVWVPLEKVLQKTIRWTTCKEILVASWPLGLMLFFNAIYFRIDTVILSFFRSAQEVGLYGLAYRIIESTLFFPAMFGGLILPRITAALAKHDIPQAQQWLEQAVRFVLITAVLGAVLLVFLGRPLAVLFGHDFSSAGSLLSILSLAMIIMFVGNMFGFTLVALGQGRYLLRLYAGLVVLNMGLNIVFIPWYGAVAASWTTVITEITSLTVAAWLVYRSIPWRLATIPLFRLALNAVATIGILLLLPLEWDVVVRLAIASGFYFLLAWWLQLFNRSTLHLLLQRA